MTTFLPHLQQECFFGQLRTFAKMFFMSEPRKPKRFINLPQYPGGKKAFVDFIVANLRYPEAAQQARIEGAVIVEYEIDSDGQAIRFEFSKALVMVAMRKPCV